MKIPFQTIDWSTVETISSPGASGVATMREVHYGDPSNAGQALRMRMVEYSANYLADHWCQLGHLIYILEGELILEMENGEASLLKAGSSFVVSDGLSSHRVRTVGKVKTLVVDGAFLG
jgi:quercetin dioxygenase-like cupin family protein